jgi:sensor domain CHASE-containing protein
MKAKVQSSPLTSQVTLTVLALAAFSLAMVVGFGYYATARADRDSLEKQKLFVADGIRDRVETVIRQQQSVTVRDETVLNVRANNQ